MVQVLAKKAAHGFKSPVYLSVGVHRPCNPLHVIPTHPPARYAGHNWDLVAAIESWDFYQIHMGVQPYVPCADDRAWGTSMRRQWVNLTRHGRIDAFTPLNGSAGYTVGLQTASGVDMHAGYGQERCTALLSAGFNESFWLTN